MEIASKGVSSSNAGMKKNKENWIQKRGEKSKKELIFQERNSTRNTNFLESEIITNKSFIDIFIPKENTRYKLRGRFWSSYVVGGEQNKQNQKHAANHNLDEFEIDRSKEIHGEGGRELIIDELNSRGNNLNPKL